MEITKISDSSHFDMAISLLCEGFTETRESWERLFYRYIPSEGNYGLLAIENGTPVGVVLIFTSNKLMHKKQVKIVNFSAWYVKKDYRYIALQLVILILKEYSDESTIFVNHSASKTVRKIFLNLGFTTISKIDQLVPTFIVNPFFNRKVSVEIASKANINQITAEDKKKFKDHDIQWFEKIIYQLNGQNHETLIFKKIRRKGIPLLKLIYASSPQDLLAISTKLKILALRNSFLFLSFPSSFSYRNFPWCIKDISSAPILVKSLFKVDDLDKIYLEDSFSGLN